MAVTTSRIIEHFDVIEHIGSRVGHGFAAPPIHPLPFQRSKKRLGDGIVPAVAATAHARLQAMISAEAMPVVTAVLRSLIRVDQDCLPRSASSHRHQDGIKDDVLMPWIFMIWATVNL